MPTWLHIFFFSFWQDLNLYKWRKCELVYIIKSQPVIYKKMSKNLFFINILRDHPWTTSAIFPDFWHPPPPSRQFFSTVRRQFWPNFDPFQLPTSFMDGPIAHQWFQYQKYSQSNFLGKSWNSHHNKCASGLVCSDEWSLQHLDSLHSNCLCKYYFFQIISTVLIQLNYSPLTTFHEKPFPNSEF